MCEAGKGEDGRKEASASRGHGACRRRNTHSPSEPSLTPIASPMGHSMAATLHLCEATRSREPSLEATCRYERKVSAGKEGVRQGLAGPTTPSVIPDPRLRPCWRYALAPTSLIFTRRGRWQQSRALGRLPRYFWRPRGGTAPGRRNRPDPVEGDLATLARTTNTHSLSSGDFIRELPSVGTPELVCDDRAERPRTVTLYITANAWRPPECPRAEDQEINHGASQHGGWLQREEGTALLREVSNSYSAT